MILWLADRTPNSKKEQPAPSEKPKESGRETVDQLLYSFVLLIIGRAFLLEPFVIPTGSMAPTLYGRHKECVCASCGFQYQIGASSEVTKGGAYLAGDSRTTIARCPNCRFANDVKKSRAFNGDHVAVNKWIYQLGSPDRFDVFVFKFPLEPFSNYIKRLVGLPGETIRIRDGDLYLVTDDGDQILRKDQPRKRRAMTQLVYDNRYPSPMLAEAGWPERWMVHGPDGSTKSSNEDRGYSVGAGESLMYTHFVPDRKDWRAIETDEAIVPQPKLVSDFCGYNASAGVGEARGQDECSQRGVFRRPSADEIGGGDYWVSDIGFEGKVALSDDESTAITLELVDGVYRYRCHIDASTGKAQLVNVNVAQDMEDERPMAEAATPVRAGGKYKLRFSNIDHEILLWVDDTPVSFGDGGRYTRTALDDNLPTVDDLAPIRILVDQGTAAVSDLMVFRDVYYTPEGSDLARGLRCELASSLNDPSLYATIYEQAGDNEKTTVVSSSDGYLAFGDNSPRSNDSRLWPGIQSVPQNHLVGKAFWVYWPHGVPFMNGGDGFTVRSYFKKGMNGVQKVPDYPRNSVPFYPQFSRMARIR